MVKKRSTSEDVEKQITEFGNEADSKGSNLNTHARRGKRNGGADRLITLNEFEDQLIAEAAKNDNRTVLGFIRHAAISQAKSIVEENI